MATERTFDYDYLRDLLRQHPDWPLNKLANHVTEHERQVQKDPHYGPILPPAIASAKSRYRDAWAAEGVSMPLLRRASTARNQPWTNIPKEYWNDVRIEYLRTLTRIARGETGISPAHQQGAESYARRLRDNREVIDLSVQGKPYTRAARPDELDQEGNLVTYHSRFPGLTSEQWTSLGTPENRAIASMRFLTDYDAPPMPGLGAG